MEVLDTSIANVALPYIAGGLSVGRSQSTWVLTSYLVANAIVLPLSGWLMGLFGRKRFYMTCVFLFTISSALCGAAPNIELLILFRVLQGLGGGGLQPSEQGILVDTFPPEPQGHGHGDLRRGRRRRADPRPRARRLHQRQLLLAMDLLYQHPDRHRLAHPDQLRRPGPARDGRGGAEELAGGPRDRLHRAGPGLARARVARSPLRQGPGVGLVRRPVLAGPDVLRRHGRRPGPRSSSGSCATRTRWSTSACWATGTSSPAA